MNQGQGTYVTSRPPETPPLKSGEPMVPPETPSFNNVFYIVFDINLREPTLRADPPETPPLKENNLISI
jgi:hypothetical protein